MDDFAELAFFLFSVARIEPLGFLSLHEFSWRFIDYFETDELFEKIRANRQVTHRMQQMIAPGLIFKS